MISEQEFGKIKADWERLQANSFENMEDWARVVVPQLISLAEDLRDRMDFWQQQAVYWRDFRMNLLKDSPEI